ncbi:hypothetical protein F1728_20540 [Gimesia benthica]|uniref:Uncharacterized protein n=1 Tax=Gimesia benthica TaxID=2608982 RepID=A0A6I6AEQ9_9PLAN|nr:hypothetical protein [Gimesia benthica]QGQ24933.1 hypothetical protein F1728_20540 [Gimesia benthica]
MAFEVGAETDDYADMLGSGNTAGRTFFNTEAGRLNHCDILSPISDSHAGSGVTHDKTAQPQRCPHGFEKCATTMPAGKIIQIRCHEKTTD